MTNKNDTQITYARTQEAKKLAAAVGNLFQMAEGHEWVKLIGQGDEKSNLDALTTFIRERYWLIENQPARKQIEIISDELNEAINALI